MIKAETILAIKTEKLINNKLRVVNNGNGMYTIVGYNYGVEEVKYRGDAIEVAKFLNQYFGYSE